MGKEVELVCEVEKYWLEIGEFTSTNSLGSGISLPEEVWTVFHSGVALDERHRAGVGILSLDKRLISCTFRLRNRS